MLSNNKKLIPQYYFYIIYTVILLSFTMFPLLLFCKYAHPQNVDNYIAYHSYQEQNDKIGASASYFADFIHFVRPGKRFISFFSSRLFLMIPKTLTVENITAIVLVHRLYALSIILMFVLSLFFLVYQCNVYFLSLSFSKFCFIYSLILYIILNSLVRIDFFLYEMTLSAGYTMGLCLYFLYVGLLIRYYHSTRRLLTIQILSYIILFLLCGTIEYFPVLAGYTAFVFLIIHFIKYKRIELTILLQFLYCLVAFAGFIFEPSNVHKVNLYSSGIQNPYTISRFLTWFRNMNTEVKNIFVYFLQLRILPLLIFISFLLKNRINIDQRFALLFICMNYVICYIMAFAIFVSGLIDFKNNAAIQIPYELMVINTLLLFLVVLTKYSIKITTTDGKSILPTGIYNIRLTAAFILYIIYFSVISPGFPVRQAWKDILKGNAYAYDKQIMQLYDEIRYSTEDTVIINEINTAPESLRAQNIWSTTGNLSLMQDYANGTLEAFFHKKCIVIKKTSN